MPGRPLPPTPNSGSGSLSGPGKGAGHARRIGMDAACERLLTLGKPYGLISSTDADTIVAPDWLSTQLLPAKCGARAIGGRIELAEGENLPENLSRWRQDQGTNRYQNLLAEHDEISSNILEHWQFSGASLSLTAEVYKEIGGLEPLAALEDEYLERVLRQRGVQIERPLSVKVRTSARQDGRADRGLARDLALASWFHRNTYQSSDFDVERLVEVKDKTVSLLLTGESFPPGTMAEVNRLQKSGFVGRGFGSRPGTGGRREYKSGGPFHPPDRRFNATVRPRTGLRRCFVARGFLGPRRTHHGAGRGL